MFIVIKSADSCVVQKLIISIRGSIIGLIMMHRRLKVNQEKSDSALRNPWILVWNALIGSKDCLKKHGGLKKKFQRRVAGGISTPRPPRIVRSLSAKELEVGWWAYAHYLARTFNYHQAGRNCINDLPILQGHLWGGWFQAPTFERGRNTGEKEREPSGRKESICSGHGVFIRVVISSWS